MFVKDMIREVTIAPPEANADGTCAYHDCSNIRPPRKRKWCSEQCAVLSNWERNWNNLRYLIWVRDNFRCVKCKIKTWMKWETHTWIVPPRFVKGAKRIDKVFGLTKDSTPNDWVFAIVSMFKRYNKVLPLLIRDTFNKTNYKHYIDPKLDDLNSRGEVDHIFPIYKGGLPMDQDNMQLLCHKCHAVKTGMDRRKSPKAVKKEVEIDRQYTSLKDF